MERRIIVTRDGSNSVAIPEMNVTYHSLHGAIQESGHVFIKHGLMAQIKRSEDKEITIFEMGLGTGLNALLTLIIGQDLGQKIYYETCEPFPLDHSVIKSLNYCRQLHREDLQTDFEQLHDCDWEKVVAITEGFHFYKTRRSLADYDTSKLKTSIYFDAFDPDAQPELWTGKIFEKMFSILEPGGILVTYSSKGIVRRAMETAGFIVEKLPGPPGKREVIRALKPD